MSAEFSKIPDAGALCEFCHKSPSVPWFARLWREGDPIQICSPSCLIGFLAQVKILRSGSLETPAPSLDSPNDEEGAFGWYDLSAGMEILAAVNQK
jgi:hypothetical protein